MINLIELEDYVNRSLDTLKETTDPIKFVELAYEVNARVAKVIIDWDLITCKRGCSHCCTKSTIGISFIEMNYMVTHSAVAKKQLKRNPPNIINSLMLKLTNESLSPNTLGDCPFLLNNECSVYEYRPFACRTFYSTDKLSLCEQGAEHQLINSTSSDVINHINELLQRVSFMNKEERGLLEVRDWFDVK